jgi:hypothetical protein
MNGFVYTNLLQILHLFVYCIEPHNRVKFDPGDKNDRKNHYIAPGYKIPLQKNYAFPSPVIAVRISIYFLNLFYYPT